MGRFAGFRLESLALELGGECKSPRLSQYRTITTIRCVEATYDEFTKVEWPVVSYADQAINAVDHPEGASAFLRLRGCVLHCFCQNVVIAIDFV